MSTHFPVITVCGSMRYYQEMLKSAEQLTSFGYVVLMPFVSDYAGGMTSDEKKKMLDDMHRQKIDMANAILVVGEHRGESTLVEINYAHLSGKPVFKSISEVLEP